MTTEEVSRDPDCPTSGGYGVSEGGDKEITSHRRRPAASPSESSALEAHGVPPHLPSTVEIKKALPGHCFESSLPLSIYYLVKDFACIALLYLLSSMAWCHLPHVTQFVVTPFYWLLSGTFMWALFVVGHEGGHGSFSKYEIANDIAGNISHGFLLIPYFMWKLSHRHHHKNTGNIDKEEVFYPIRERDHKEGFVLPAFGLGIAWYSYLIRGYNPRPVNHFNIWHPMFSRHVWQCCLSLVVVIGWAVCLLHLAKVWGWGWLLYHYVAPLFVFASYLVVVTFLHHGDVDTPWYSDNVWTYVRGQLSSVDRDYGWCHTLTHNIGTHQIHHLFPIIPHYHLEEATRSFRAAFPHLVRKRDEPILSAFWKNFKIFSSQHIIADDTIVHVYKPEPTSS